MDLKTLNFDMYQRYRAIGETLDLLFEGCAGRPKILDVGGFPGTLAEKFPKWDWTVVDSPLCARKDYVAGTGDSLPFREKSFDAVVSSDTIEHVRPGEREKFFAELARVAKRWIVVGAPFANPNTDYCETALCALHEKMRGTPHPWLSEHRDNGLPRLADALRSFSGRGMRAVWTPNGGCALWFLMMGLQTLSESLPDFFPVYEFVNARFNEHWAALAVPGGSYRQIVVVAVLREDFARLDRLPGCSEKFEMSAEAQAVDGSLKSLGEILLRLGDWAVKIRNAEGGPAGGLAADYVKRLEAALREKEELLAERDSELSALRAELGGMEASAWVQWLRKLHLITGRPQ
ncbi:MAG: class I SAM-dependent methyltransferase [bacterium]